MGGFRDSVCWDEMFSSPHFCGFLQNKEEHCRSNGAHRRNTSSSSTCAEVPGRKETPGPRWFPAQVVLCLFLECPRHEGAPGTGLHASVLRKGDLKAGDFQMQCSGCLTVLSGWAYAACSLWRAGKHSRGWTCLHFRGMMLWSLLSPSRFCSPSHSGCCWDSTSQSRKLSKKRKLFCLRSKSEVRKEKKKVISACNVTGRRAPEDIPGGSAPDQREARRGCERIDDRVPGLNSCPHGRPLELQRPWVIWYTQKWSPLQGIPWVLQGHSFLSVSTKRTTQISQIQILSPFQKQMYHKVKKKGRWCFDDHFCSFRPHSMGQMRVTCSLTCVDVPINTIKFNAHRTAWRPLVRRVALSEMEAINVLRGRAGNLQINPVRRRKPTHLFLIVSHLDLNVDCFSATKVFKVWILTIWVWMSFNTVIKFTSYFM